MQKLKTILNVAFVAVAVTTTSLAVTGQAHAKGGGRHFAHFSRGIYFSAPVYASCWKWIGGQRVYVCY
jgi:hypothetical protein